MVTTSGVLRLSLHHKVYRWETQEIALRGESRGAARSSNDKTQSVGSVSACVSGTEDMGKLISTTHVILKHGTNKADPISAVRR